MKNKTILITGAAGTIGSGLVAALHKNNTVVAVDKSEYGLYALNREFNTKSILGDLIDDYFVHQLSGYDFDYIFHCAAYKHVDILEDAMDVAHKNNVGSLRTALQIPCKRFIFLSSDKAVDPSCVMGVTKNIGEQMVKESTNGIRKIVRFGNVYGSSGSFIETMKWQIANDLPVTVTDKEMTRYFLSRDQAVQMLINVVNIDDDSATYILDMGDPVKIVDLVPEGYPIIYIGIRPGEKLHEVLYSGSEGLEDTSDPLIKRIDWNE